MPKPSTAHPPAGEAARPTVILDTRLPGSGEALTLIAGAPDSRWDATEDRPLGDALRPALAWLAQQGPDALLAGVADYPADPHSTGSRLAVLGYRSHWRLPRSQPLRAPDAPWRAAPDSFALRSRFAPDLSADAYCSRVARIQDLLQAGDVYQVNLAQRFSATCDGDALAPWLALRDAQQPPWAAWVDLGARQIIGLSPECFLEVADRQVSTYPIKGTRPRGADPAVDETLRGELATSAKDRAENLMIVDLLRNDLGRVCVPGSIRTPALFEVRSFPSVHHLVSTVVGELDRRHDLADLLQACFPGGSITGAPKRRAREVIRELESGPRGAYCGSVFWADRHGHFGSNISIRTLAVEGGRIECWGGAGIVADSRPESEYRECLDKVGPLMRVLEERFYIPK